MAELLSCYPIRSAAQIPAATPPRQRHTLRITYRAAAAYCPFPSSVCASKEKVDRVPPSREHLVLLRQDLLHRGAGRTVAVFRSRRLDLFPVGRHACRRLSAAEHAGPGL